ncbi:unnamed protein product [Rhizoctonia solani]|nr:unnamed protein product [Rhizoctonia solani]
MPWILPPLSIGLNTLLSALKMRSRRNPSKSSISLDESFLKSKPEVFSARNSTEFIYQDLSTKEDRRLTAKLLSIIPLVIHCLASVAIAITLLYYLDTRQFYLERQPQIKLADGTYEVDQLGKFNILQSDITTILSSLLMILRWVAAAWAGPLGWRAIFLLAENYGLRYRDIEWVTNYGVLHPTTPFQRPLNLLLGVILIFTLAPFPASPLLTGSISWIPSSSTVELPYHPAINVTGVHPNNTMNALVYSGEYHATFPTDVVKNFNTAWSQAVEPSIFRRVVPAISHLSINSTIENIVVPHFAVTNIEWLPKLEDKTWQLFQTMRQDRANFLRFPQKMSQPGAAALIVSYTSFEGGSSVILDSLPSTWSMIVNVAKELDPKDCNSSTTFLPNNTTISPFHLAFNTTPGYVFEGKMSGCFVYAKVTYHAASGHCKNCRVISPSTVQNDTKLENLGPEEGDPSIDSALVDMPQYMPSMTPLKDSIPDLANGIEVYITALLTRLYSALWTSWSDAYGITYVQSSRYKPAVSTLKVEINKTRVYAWLILQLLATLAGLVFLHLQRTSDHPVLSDTSMIAFDIDSTRVPKPDGASKHTREEMLKIEPKEDGWRVVLASSRSSNDPQ